jgi:biotin operon repressor
MTSKKAQAFINKKISKLRHEGVPQKQAEAEAISIARQKGYKVPLPSHVRKAEREP